MTDDRTYSEPTEDELDAANDEAAKEFAKVATSFAPGALDADDGNGSFSPIPAP